jgi:phosphatidate phosphatase LPIN
MKDNLPVASPGHEHLRNQDVQSLTQQPFGETERLAEDDDLKDVAFLDLNAPPAAGTAHASTGGQRAQSAASSSVLGIAASDIAPNPSLTDHGDSPSANLQEGPADSSEVRHKRNKSQPAPHRPLRDLGADTGEESSSLPASNHTPSRIPDDINNSRANGLPCVGTGEGAGPGVLEGNDVVLDMDGYHTEDRDRSTMGPSGKRGGAEVQYSVLDTFTRDLLAAVPSEKRPVMPLRATDPDFHPPGSPESDSLALSPDLEDRDLRRFDRAKSEPPVDSPEPLSPNLDPTKTASAMDYAWDWGRIPDGSDVQKQLSPERRGTLPPIDLPSHGTATRLKNVEENPFLFVFDADGRTHTFELALCDTASSTDLPVSDHFKATAFLDNRVSFQAFIENPSIVDNPKLVVRYSLR